MRTEKKKSKRWIKIIGIILVLLIAGGGAYAFSIYKSLTECS